MHPIFLYYPMDVPSKQVSELPFPIFQEGEHYFFILPAENEKVIQEMHVIGQFFHYHQWYHVMFPLLNSHQQLITPIGKDKYMLCYARKKNPNFTFDLAQFHKVGSMFPYQVTNMNHYGNWKKLWIQKIDQHEAMYQKFMQHRPVNGLLREYIDFFPYVLGVAENAIQYLTATEKAGNFTGNDQSTFTFGRYNNQLESEFINVSELVADHPVRDIAEWMRPQLFAEQRLYEGWNSFGRSYIEQIPLSSFGWNLLFSRLLFPIHIFDIFEKLYENNFELTHFYHLPIDEYERYEKNLQYFFSTAIEQQERDGIQLDWL